MKHITDRLYEIRLEIEKLESEHSELTKKLFQELNNHPKKWREREYCNVSQEWVQMCHDAGYSAKTVMSNG